MSDINTQQNRRKNPQGQKGNKQSSKNRKKLSDEESKKAREVELEAKIKEIWKDVNEDVEWLSQPPSDSKSKKRWSFTRIFHGGGPGNGKDDAKSPPESENNEHQDDIKITTVKILGILHEAKPEPSKDTSDKYEKLKKTVANTIKCINVLGERVAGAASLTFAPAPSCFNAISFFLQFWINYVEMFDKIDQLLSTCNDFIGRLHIYKMDDSGEKVIELQYIAAQLLRSTVKVFRFSISISSSKKDIMKKLAKQSFLGESDIDELMGGMGKLVEQENNLLTALSYGNVRNIQQILAQQQTTADAKGWRIAIAKALGFGDEEPKRAWKNRLEEISGLLIPETGNWVENLEEFENWVALDDDNAARKEKGSEHTRPILIVEGAENTGKTYLMANIARHLGRIRPNHSVAYYFHEGGSDRHMDRSRLLSLVSRSLLWQCSTFSGLLIKSMAERCQKMGYNPNVYDIWRQLFLQNEEIRKVKQPFYILIDGLEGMLLEDIISFINQLVDRGEQTFRVLVSRRNSSVQEHLKKGSFGRIRLRDENTVNNRLDIQTYIQHSLRNMSAFDETHHPKAEEYRNKITTILKEKTEGNFAWMTVILDKLRSKHHLADIDMILENVNEPKEKQAKDEIERLNRELTSEEIKEINEVILWVLTAQVTPSVDDMAAVLSLGPHTDSLMPLRRRLNPLLNVNESGKIHFKLSEFKDQILKNQTLVLELRSDETSVTLLPPKAEMEVVHRFLIHVFPRREDYEKEALERILWGEPSKSLKPAICYDNQNAHIKMALTYLKVLTNGSNEQTNALRFDAGRYLLYHIKKANQKTADKDLKAKIGLLLVKLFTEGDCIDTLFWTRAEHMSHNSWEESEGAWLKENRERWLYTSTGVIEMAKWFSDEEVTGDIVGPGKDLVKSITDKKNIAGRHEILLRAVAERLATHLLLENIYTRREQLTAVYFLNGYVTRIGNQKNMTPCQKDRDRLPWKEFCRIKDWATRLHGFHDSWLWKIQVARTIFTVCDGYDNKANKAAEGLLHEVQELDGEIWEGSILACQTIAEHLVTENSYAKAQKILEKATERFYKDQGGVQVSKSDSMLVAIAFLDLGDIYWKLEQYDRAVATNLQSLKYDTTRYARYFDILREYSKKEETWPKTVEFLDELTVVKEFDKLYLNRLVYDFLAKDDFREFMAKAKEHKDWKKVVDKTFTQAIEVANGSPAELFHIRNVYGRILHECAGASREEEAVQQWEKALESGKPLAVIGSDIQWSHIADIIEPLAKIYLRRAEDALAKARSVNIDDYRPAEFVKEIFDMASHDFDLLKKLEQKTDIWVNTVVYCCLARYYKVSKDETKAKKAVAKVIAASIAVLSDSDESNDWFAFIQLGKVFNALQDAENSEEAWERLDVFGKSPSDLWPPFYCAGCNTKVPLAEGVWVCTECFGPKYFDAECYGKRELNGCSTTHKGVNFNPEIQDSDIGTSMGNLDRKNDLNRWKIQLQLEYLEGEDIGDAAKLAPIDLLPTRMWKPKMTLKPSITRADLSQMLRREEELHAAWLIRIDLNRPDEETQAQKAVDKVIVMINDQNDATDNNKDRGNEDSAVEQHVEELDENEERENEGETVRPRVEGDGEDEDSRELDTYQKDGAVQQRTDAYQELVDKYCFYGGRV
ncbi:hypothetical protein BU16DRAFT_615567 [Lophium mytilinum]|uniref:Uncharacterized protein n=1 Tax=Lophium mytilinum TaxID=390894 RepID=A0A6A6R504_9PEZI|nr:hypothetical protein BU16DRAFT_615567 [Lophium mytilinum]